MQKGSAALMDSAKSPEKDNTNRVGLILFELDLKL